MEVDSTAHIAKILEGFTLSSKSGKGKKVFPPPTLPKHFRPVHINVKHQKFLLPQVQQLASTSSSAAAAKVGIAGADPQQFTQMHVHSSWSEVHLLVSKCIGNILKFKLTIYGIL